jgi:TonB family protein
VVKSTIERNWLKPAGFGNENTPLRVRVLVKVTPDGRLHDPAITESSGSRMYDHSVLRAIIKTDGLPPIPYKCENCSEIEFLFGP